MIALLADRRIQIVILVVAALLVANYSGLLTLYDDNVRFINNESELTDNEKIALASILITGEEGDPFSVSPHDVHLDAIAYGDGYIWASQAMTQDIRKYDENWNLIDIITLDYVSDRDYVYGLKDIAYSNGYIWGVQHGTKTIFKFNADDGSQVFSFIPTLMQDAYGIAADGNNVWVSSLNDKCIQRYTVTGNSVDTIYPRTNSFSEEIKRICSFDDFILFSTNTDIYKIGKDGTFTGVPISSFDTDGIATNGINIWSSSSNGRIYKYDMEIIYSGMNEWVLYNIPVDYGFTEYIGLSNRKQIKATFIPIEAEIPDILPEGIDFNINVDIGKYNDIDTDISLEFFAKDGSSKGIYTGYPPTIIVDNLDTFQIDMLQITAERDGIEQYETFDVKAGEVSLKVYYTGGFECSHPFTLDVSYSPEIDCDPSDKEIEVILQDKYGNELGHYDGSMPSITVTDPLAYGDVDITVKASYRDIPVQEWKKRVWFSGIPATAESTTASYDQYHTIKFRVRVENSHNMNLPPTDLSNLRAECDLSHGTVTSKKVTSLGSGLYEVVSQITGTGVFSGRILFTYMTKEITSDWIQITVNSDEISINTYGVPATGTRNELFKSTITCSDAQSQLTDVDSITVHVKKPDGYSTDDIPFSEITKVSTGTYTFDYTPDDVETFTFEITAQKSGLAQGFSTTQVFINTEKDVDPTASSDLVGILLDYWYIVLILLIAVVILIWRFR